MSEMIETLYIHKFKRIELSAKFYKLSRVNYFVGENGSGKSSVLEYLFNQYRSQAVFLKDDLAAVDFWREIGFSTVPVQNEEGIWWKNIFEILLSKRLAVLDLFAYLAKFSTDSEQALTQHLQDPVIIAEAKKILQDLEILLTFDQSHTDLMDHEELFGGQKKLLNIVCGILIAHKTLNNQLFLFDEPEVHLHPSWQKRLPDLFAYISQLLDVQFFIATHSPFIISSVSEFMESQRDWTEDDPEHVSTQKVYFLKEGRVADKHGQISNYGSNGYTGKGVNYITGKMLGVGLMDFITAQTTVSTKDAPKLVLCEGEGIDQDAKIYNIIFRDMMPNVLFVSCRGSTQLHKTFRLLKEIKPGLSANLEILMVRDRDHEYPTIEDISDYKKENEQCMVLYRRAIEAYLYNSETAKLVLKTFGKKLCETHKQLMDQLQEMVKISAEQGVPGDAYKNELEQLFNRITENLARTIDNPGSNLPEKIAWLITPKTRVYKELHKQIFG